MQRRHVVLGNNPPKPPSPHPPIISQSSLKTPHPWQPPLPFPTHTYPLIHTRNITKHDYVTKPVSLEKGEALWNSATPPPPVPPAVLPLSPPSSVREGRQGLGAVVPFVCLGVVHLQRVEELVSVEAAHGVDGVAQHGHTCVAAWRCHAAQHPPLIAGGVVYLHTAERVGAVEAANDKQFACTERKTSATTKRDQFVCPAQKLNHLHSVIIWDVFVHTTWCSCTVCTLQTLPLAKQIWLHCSHPPIWLLAHQHGQQRRPPCEPHSWGLSGSRCCSQGCSVPQCSGSSTTLLLQSRTWSHPTHTVLPGASLKTSLLLWIQLFISLLPQTRMDQS